MYTQFRGMRISNGDVLVGALAAVVAAALLFAVVHVIKAGGGHLTPKRDALVCYVVEGNGVYFVQTADGQHYELADTVDWQGESTQADRAADRLMVGTAYELTVQMVPVLSWNTLITGIGDRVTTKQRC